MILDMPTILVAPTVMQVTYVGKCANHANIAGAQNIARIQYVGVIEPNNQVWDSEKESTEFVGFGRTQR
jgi:hypothetical protein